MNRILELSRGRPARRRRARCHHRRSGPRGRRARAALRARSGERGHLDDRREHRDQRGRSALRQVRRDPGQRAGPGGGARGRHGRAHRPPYGQGRHRLRPHRPAHRLRGHPGGDHLGDRAAAARAGGDGHARRVLRLLRGGAPRPRTRSAGPVSSPPWRSWSTARSWHAIDPALRERGAALLLVQCDGAGAAAEAEAVARLLAPSGHVRRDDRGPGRGRTAARRPPARPARPRTARPPADRGHRGAPLTARGGGSRDPRPSPYVTTCPSSPSRTRRTGTSTRSSWWTASLPGLPDAAWEAAGEIFALALRLGGTLTGEHGVGVLKRQWVADELGPAAHALQRRIKQAFDPRGVLNPGKCL